MSLTGTATFRIGTSFTSPLDLSTPSDNLTKLFSLTIADGVAVGEANRIFHDRRALASAATEDLDLNGSLLDAFGAAFDLARAKIIAFVNDPLNDGSSDEDLLLGPAAVNGFDTWINGTTPAIVIPPGHGFFLGGLSADGYVVTATTADLLTVTAGGGGSVGLSYDVVIIGGAT